MKGVFSLVSLSKTASQSVISTFKLSKLNIFCKYVHKKSKA